MRVGDLVKYKHGAGAGRIRRSTAPFPGIIVWAAWLQAPPASTVSGHDLWMCRVLWADGIIMNEDVELLEVISEAS